VGGGGGLSAVFYRPWWQEGPGVSNSYSNGMREMPDVSANADPNSGYSMYTVDDKGNGTWDYVGGGTSASTPLWAGFGAILDQYLRSRAGFLNPTLYALGQKASTFQYAPFHDVTQGNNLYYPATPGYDLASGWGSFDATALVNAVSALGGALPQVVITGGALQHAVNGKWKNTTTLKLKQTGLFAVAYTTLHAASLPVSATATEYRNNKALTSWKMAPITFTDGAHGFTLKLHWSKTSSRGIWGMNFTVSAGSYSDTYYIQFQIK
jgi:subtilase family serine protease